MVDKEITKTSDTWNVADGYVKFKILIPLVRLDDLIRVAKYGAIVISDSIGLDMADPNLKRESRIEAIQRLIDELRLIIENSNFCVKPAFKITLKKLGNDLDEVEKYLPGIERVITNDTNHTRIKEINEKHFKVCLDFLRDIKKRLNEPLNQSGLIFPSSDIVDLESIKLQLIEGG